MNNDANIKETTLTEATGTISGEMTASDQTTQKIEEKYLQFINKNYTPEQRAEILQSLKQNDKGEITWKDGNDYIKLSLDENGRLRKGVLHDSKENGAYSEFQFKLNNETDYKFKETSYDKDDGKTKSSEKSRTDDDKTVISTRDSQYNHTSLTANKEVQKTKTTYQADNDGNTIVTSQKVSSSTTSGTALGAKYEKERLTVNYDEQGNILNTEHKTVGANAILATELGASKSSTKTEYTADGQIAEVNKKNLGVELHRTGISIEGSTQSANYEDGNMSYTQKGLALDVRAGGNLRTSVNVASAHEVTNDDGTKERHEQSLNFNVGTHDLGFSSLTAQTLTQEDGNSERVVKTASAAVGLNRVRAEAHKQTIVNTDGVENVNKTGMALNLANTPKEYVKSTIMGTDYTLNSHDIGDGALRKEAEAAKELATTMKLQTKLPNNNPITDAKQLGLDVAQYTQAEQAFNQAVDERTKTQTLAHNQTNTLSPTMQTYMQKDCRD